MSLLLRCHVDEYRIDACRGGVKAVRAEAVGAALLEPLADQVPVQPIMLDDEHPLHGGPLP